MTEKLGSFFEERGVVVGLALEKLKSRPLTASKGFDKLASRFSVSQDVVFSARCMYSFNFAPRRDPRTVYDSRY